VRITRQTMYVSPNNELRLCNLCCNGKAMSIMYSECVFVALCVQHSIRMHHIMWPVGLYNILHIISKTAQFSKKVIENTTYVLFSVHLFSEKFFIIEEFSDILS
jgi:hypothetical protein